MGARLRSGLRFLAAALWVTAAVLLGRLAIFIAAGVLLDDPPRHEEVLPLLGRGWSLLVGAVLLIAAGWLVWWSTRSPLPRTWRVELGVALLLAVAVAGVWLLRRTESFPDAGPNDAIPGQLAWLSRAEIGAPSCLSVMEPGGSDARVVYCAPPRADLSFGPGGGGGWSPQGELVFNSSGAADSMLVFVDPIRGIEVDAISALGVAWPSPHVRPDGARLATGHWWRGAQVMIEQPGRATVRAAAISGPHDYEILDAEWSPDGNWIAMRDSDGRLLATSAERDAPRVLAAGGVSRYAWFIVGNPTYTIALPDLPSDVRLCQGYRHASLPCGFDYASYVGDLTNREVRALLLVLDEEYLTQAILIAAPAIMPPAVVSSVESSIQVLEQLATNHAVALPANSWLDPPFPTNLDQGTACRWTMYEAFAEGHIIGAVRPTVTAPDLAAALDAIDGALGERVESLRNCAARGAEPTE